MPNKAIYCTQVRSQSPLRYSCTTAVYTWRPGSDTSHQDSPSRSSPSPSQVDHAAHRQSRQLQLYNYIYHSAKPPCVIIMRARTPGKAGPALTCSGLALALLCLLATFSCTRAAGPRGSPGNPYEDATGKPITGCPCKVDKSCNDCCIVEHGAFLVPC
jgi:hypothetical protein